MLTSKQGWFVDPYATGEASYQSIKGLQDSGVAATSKHVSTRPTAVYTVTLAELGPMQFIGYEQDTYRNQYNQTEGAHTFLCFSLEDT